MNARVQIHTANPLQLPIPSLLSSLCKLTFCWNFCGLFQRLLFLSLSFLQVQICSSTSAYRYERQNGQHTVNSINHKQKRTNLVSTLNSFVNHHRSRDWGTTPANWRTPRSLCFLLWLGIFLHWLSKRAWSVATIHCLLRWFRRACMPATPRKVNMCAGRALDGSCGSLAPAPHASIHSPRSPFNKTA